MKVMGQSAGRKSQKVSENHAASFIKHLSLWENRKKITSLLIPVCSELDLKKAAAAAGEKSIHMIPQKELFPLTGYVHGGCSPIGMKKQFPTFLHITAKEQRNIMFSAGKIGVQVELSPDDLNKIIHFYVRRRYHSGRKHGRAVITASMNLRRE